MANTFVIGKPGNPGCVVATRADDGTIDLGVYGLAHITKSDAVRMSEWLKDASADGGK